MADTPPVSNSKTKLTDDIRSAFSGDAPLTQKMSTFVKARPLTSAVFATLAAGALFGGARRGR